jgi:hypothetical protein
VRRTIELALSLPLDQASFAFLVPFPGTRMWEMCERGEGLRLLGDGWPSFVRYETPVAEPSGLPAALLASLHAEACRRFYLRPGYLARRLGIVMRNRARARLLRVNLRMLLGIARSSLSSPGRAAPQPS